MRHGSLFSGIGGFDLAAQWVGWTNVFQVEIENFPIRVLEKNFPNVQRFRDIKEFDGKQFAGTIDVLSGGFPCQPFSVAGKRKGNEDDRALWPEMLRIIQEVKPRWIIGENVAGFVNMALDESITDLENEGYEVQAFIIPACAVNAPHRRDRVWIVANHRREYEETNRQWTTAKSKRPITCDGDRVISNTQSGSDRVDTPEHEGGQDHTGRFEQVDTHAKTTERKSSGRTRTGREGFADRDRWNENWYEVATRFCRVDDGVPNRVDRLKSLGNAIVPQVAYEIFKAINECHVR